MPLSARFERDVVRDWSFVLRVADLPAARVERAARRAIAHGSPFARELVITGAIEERLLFELIAQALGLAFAGEVRPETIVTREAHERLLLAAGLDLPPVRLLLGDETAVLALSGYSIDIEHWHRRLERSPGLRGRLVVVPPTVLRGAIQKRSRTWLMRDAVYSLRLNQENFSAYQVATPRQALFVGVAVTMLPVLGWVAPWATMIALSFAASAAFLSCMLIRLFALRTARPLRLPKLSSANPARLPVYSVLVTLYREANVVPQLLVALGKIQWPRSRLEIKLVCEADDAETLSALEAHRLHPCIEVIRVPAMLPRTKPKALAYALPQCAGELVTLYDAEDRPHPFQLLEAWSRFERSDATLACVQAPLVITNGRRCWLSRMFAFEYAGLFRGLLPWLSDQGTILPLGGTSNHFRGLM